MRTTTAVVEGTAGARTAGLVAVTAEGVTAVGGMAAVGGMVVAAVGLTRMMMKIW